MAGVFDDHGLQAQAQAEGRQLGFTGELQSADLAVDAADAEAAGDHDAVDVVESGGRTFGGFATIGRNPLDVDLGPVGKAAGLDGLGDRQVGVRQIDVLADDGDVDLVLGVVHTLQQVGPFVPIDVMERQAELTHHIGVEALLEQDLRHIVDARRIHAVDHAFGIDIAHQGDLVLDGLIERAVGAQHKGVRGNAELAQHHHGVLGGLGLELVGGGNVRHQGNVHEHAVVRAEIAAHFAGGLKEGLGLDVANGTTDFGDDHIHVIGSLGAHTRLDFVGDVRDNLHALAEVFAGALLAQHFLIDLTGGDVGLLAQEDVEETLVVADVEIGFGTVFGHVDLTMLERVHGARVDVDVRIELLLQNMDTAAAQQTTERRCGQALAERGDNAASDENMLGDVFLRITMCSSNHGISLYHPCMTRRVHQTRRPRHGVLEQYE